ncbi:MAG: DegV family protein [Gordonibacter pamelaeae]|uniref:Fatty acid-binding protein DegV n=3 Tax=Gordonibacter TaxID=644652 RepID=A0A369LZ74_9ACTN|nr:MULTISPECIES: DegV family protein [Gordonibacter]MBS6974834.1 DegV family protein [Eggerthellaceae bacterium]MBS4894441.1 DegV family protein [Gordonibacter pamelaeae]MCB6311879.1 DegV family protein [Gordonibacter pamelaeae]MCB6563002.1 DegV family protein [Gordonibacter urolithinfaciens]MCB7087036.1 DegV family protein [Gordonibacter urolithinfaciens]
MPMDFEIVTDSSSNLVEEMIDDFGLHVLPLTFMVDGEEYQSYLKGQHTDLKQFYTMMREGKVITTSLPNLAESEALMRGLLEQGRDILYLGFSSGLSGTFEATELLMRDLAAEFPERTLLAVDTLAASGGEGLLVWHAVQRARAGAPIGEVRDWVEENKLHLAHWFTVDDLMFLFRGGRVSKTAAWAGTMLNIKPVMHVDDEGHLIPLEKVRGRKKSLNALVDHMEKSAVQPIDQQMVFITHGDCLEEAEYVAEQVKERFGVKEVVINYVDPVIGAHSGPGTMALFFLADKR